MPAKTPELLAALKIGEATIAATLKARGYQPGSSSDQWAPEVQGEIAALAKVRAAIAKAEAAPEKAPWSEFSRATYFNSNSQKNEAREIHFGRGTNSHHDGPEHDFRLSRGLMPEAEFLAIAELIKRSA
jgi:hypothetical protein